MDKKTVIAIGLAVVASTVAFCGPPGMFRHANFELTGQVLEEGTRTPIDGAYVLAVYQENSCGFMVGCKSHCIKTKGMYTEKDGSFHFPVEKLDNRSPAFVTAIKSGYFYVKPVVRSEKIQEAQGKENYSGRNVILAKQSPAVPSFQFGTLACDSPVSREAAEANIVFYRIMKEESQRLGASKSGIDSIQDTIEMWESTEPSSRK